MLSPSLSLLSPLSLFFFFFSLSLSLSLSLSRWRACVVLWREESPRRGKKKRGWGQEELIVWNILGPLGRSGANVPPLASSVLLDALTLSLRHHFLSVLSSRLPYHFHVLSPLSSAPARALCEAVSSFHFYFRHHSLFCRVSSLSAIHWLRRHCTFSSVAQTKLEALPNFETSSSNSGRKKRPRPPQETELDACPGGGKGNRARELGSIVTRSHSGGGEEEPSPPPPAKRCVGSTRSATSQQEPASLSLAFSAPTLSSSSSSVRLCSVTEGNIGTSWHSGLCTTSSTRAPHCVTVPVWSSRRPADTDTLGSLLHRAHSSSRELMAACQLLTSSSTPSSAVARSNVNTPTLNMMGLASPPHLPVFSPHAQQRQADTSPAAARVARARTRPPAPSLRLKSTMAGNGDRVPSCASSASRLTTVLTAAFSLSHHVLSPFCPKSVASPSCMSSANASCASVTESATASATSVSQHYQQTMSAAAAAAAASVRIPSFPIAVSVLEP